MPFSSLSLTSINEKNFSSLPCLSGRARPERRWGWGEKSFEGGGLADERKPIMMRRRMGNERQLAVLSSEIHQFADWQPP